VRKGKKEKSKEERKLIRRKSELPKDKLTIEALSDHKRLDDHLKTQPDDGNPS